MILVSQINKCILILGTLGISVLKSYRSKTVRKALLQAALIRRRLKIEGIHKKQ